MSRWHAAYPVLAMLAACERTPAAGSSDAATATGNPAEDIGSDGVSAFSMASEPKAVVPLDGAMLDGVLPPSWHAGESWEVMFCIPGDEWARKREYDTTRVTFHVAASPGPGAFTAVVMAQETIVPSRLRVRRPQIYDGLKLHPQEEFDYITPWPARKMIFDGGTFAPVLSKIQDQSGAHVTYDRINDHLSTYQILTCTPDVPSGLHEPETPGVAHRGDRARSTVTPTSDGLLFELEVFGPVIQRTVVYWRRGDPWWSFARMDAVNADTGAAIEASENGGAVWAVTLPPGQPDSVSCNPKR